MIGSAGTGSGFGGLEGYLLHGRDGDGDGRVGWVSGRNLAHDDPEYAAVEMRATADQNHRVEKPVYHLSLNAAQGEHLSREKWEQVANRVLKDLGLEDHQALLVAHTDRPHEHVHVLVNRVNPETLKTWSNSHDYARIERSLRHIERERGLREVPGHHYRLEREQEAPDRSQGLTSGEIHQRQRTGEKPFAEQARFRLYNDFKEAGSWADLEERLAGHGMRLEKRGRGLVVTDGERQVKASRIHRGRSLGKLEERYGMTFNDWRGRVAQLHGAIRDYEKEMARQDGLFLEKDRLSEQVHKMREPLAPIQSLRKDLWYETQRFDSHVRSLYHPKTRDRARRTLDAHVDTVGYRKAAELLRRDPGAYGRLDGIGLGRHGNWKRKEAFPSAKAAADTLDRIGELRRGIARRLDHDARTLWESSGRPLEAPDSLTQTRWRLEAARERLEELLPKVYRPKSLSRVRDAIEETTNPERTAVRLARKPHYFGKLPGLTSRSPERQEALRHVPALAEVVRDYATARAGLHRQVLSLREGNLKTLSQRLDRLNNKLLFGLPDTTKLLRPIARAAQRVGYRAVAHLVPLPPQLKLVKLAINITREVAGRERGVNSTPNFPPIRNLKIAPLLVGSSSV